LETKTQPELQLDDRAQDGLRQYSAPDFELLDAPTGTTGKAFSPSEFDHLHPYGPS